MLREFDIAQIIKDDIINNNSIFDLGFGDGKHLFPFKELGFKNFLGIDTNFFAAGNSLDYYYQQGHENFSVEQFKKDFELLTGPNYNFLDYEFSQKFDVILIVNVIHFVPHCKQIEYIKKAKSLLESGGILYLAYNSYQKCLNTEFMNGLEEVEYKTYNSIKGKYYLLDENDSSVLLNEFSFNKKDECFPEMWKYAERFICKR